MELRTELSNRTRSITISQSYWSRQHQLKAILKTELLESAVQIFQQELFLQNNCAKNIKTYSSWITYIRRPYPVACTNLSPCNAGRDWSIILSKDPDVSTPLTNLLLQSGRSLNIELHVNFLSLFFWKMCQPGNRGRHCEVLAN